MVGLTFAPHPFEYLQKILVQFFDILPGFKSSKNQTIPHLKAQIFIRPLKLIMKGGVAVTYKLPTPLE